MVNVTNGAERDAASGTPELAVSGLTVRFGALTALEGVSLACGPGRWWRWPGRTARARPR